MAELDRQHTNRMFSVTNPNEFDVLRVNAHRAQSFG